MITLWHRDHARKGLRQVLIVKEVKPRPPRPRFSVRWLREPSELDITDVTATKLLKIAPAAITVALASSPL